MNANEKVIPPISNVEMMKADLKAYKKALNEMLVAVGIVVPAGDDLLKYSDAYCKDVAMKKGLHANIKSIVGDDEKTNAVYQMIAMNYMNPKPPPEYQKETEETKEG